MSTEFHLHHDLPKLKIPNLKMEEEIKQNNSNSCHVSKAESVNDNCGGGDSTPTSASPRSNNNAENDGVVLEGEEEIYRTPTSKESKIPEMVTCPPAPKKAKAMASCKRKLALDEFQFFEVPSNEDMDAFFRSTYPKRTCPCT